MPEVSVWWLVLGYVALEVMKYAGQNIFNANVWPAVTAWWHEGWHGLRVAEADRRIAEYRRLQADILKPHFLTIDAQHRCAVGVSLLIVGVGLGGLGCYLASKGQDHFLTWAAAVIALAVTIVNIGAADLQKVRNKARQLGNVAAYRSKVEQDARSLLKRAGKNDEEVAAHLAELDAPLP